jgi:hypothetical protein
VLSLTLRRAGEGLAVPIHALLDKQQETEGVVLSPEDIAAIVAAYETVIERLGVADRKAPMALLVAKTTLEIAGDGERDPERLCERVIQLYRDRWLT